MRKIFAFLAKLFFSLLFTLVLIEGGLRLLPQVVPLELLIYFADTPRGEIAQRRHLPTQWGTVVVERDDGGPELRIFEPFAEIVLPGREDELTVVMDEIGFCNPPGNNYQNAKIQIIAVGDSFTTCHGVRPHETWTNQLASLSGVSVYNLGRGKSGLHEYLQLLKKFGLPKSPQIVIMNVYEGNDLRDAALYYYYRLNHSDDTPTTESQTGQSQPFWQQYSYAYNLGAASLQYGSALNSASADLPEPSDPFLFPVSDVPERYFIGIQKINFKYQIVFPDRTITLNNKNADVDEVLVARHLYHKTLEPGVMQAIDAALNTFVELSKQYHFIPVVTYTPSAHTAYAATVVYEDSSLQTLMPWFSQQQRAYFQEKGEELGYFFVDLTPALQAAAQGSNSGELLYARADLHLTPQGHLVVAKAINQALQDLKVLATRN